MENRNSAYGNLSLVEPLTQRELEVLSLIADNLTNAEIAEQLTLAVSTIKWYTRQIYGKLGVNNRRQAVQRARQLALLEDDLEAAARDRFPNNLPAQVTPFVGREQELIGLQNWLTSDDSQRLITLLGPGGIGKTRLALQAARLSLKDAENFRDGVFFVPLAGIETPALVVHAVARAIDFTFSTGGQAAGELTNYLRHKQLLLVLDNFEQLAGADSLDFLSRLMETASGVRLIVTSRARLNLRGETVFPLSGLETPRKDQVESWDNPLDQTEKWSSLQLFSTTARQVKPDFNLTESNLQTVVHICRVVEGLPLGIELAAAWTPVMTPGEIAAEIGSSLDFLESQDFGLPRRQRSLRAVFDSSLKLLDEEERQAIEALSVFRGGFTRSTAQEVFGLSPRRLLALVNKCWVQPEGDGRFGIHELLRQYAGEQLRRQPDRECKTRDQHSRYFCRLLAEREDNWHGERQLEALAEIEGEIDNIQAAWDWAVRQGKVDRIDRASESLYTYYNWSSRYEDAQFTFRTAAARLQKLLEYQEQPAADTRRTLARLLIRQSEFELDSRVRLDLVRESEGLLKTCKENGLGVNEEKIDLFLEMGSILFSSDRTLCRRYYQQALHLADHSEKVWKTTEPLLSLAGLAFQTGKYEEVRRLVERALPILQELGDRRQKADCLDLLGLILKHQGQLAEAEDLHRESLKLFLEIGHYWRTAGMLSDLAHTLNWRGKFTEARSQAEESLKIIHSLGYEDVFAYTYTALASASLHLGDIESVKKNAKKAIEIAGIYDQNRQKGFAMNQLGCAILAEGNPEQSRKYLEASYMVFKDLKQNMLGIPCAYLAFNLRRLGQREPAFKQARLALDSALQVGTFLPVVTALPALALLSADEGDWEQAVRLHALAWRYDYVANSRWFQVIAGDELEAMFQDLDEEMVRAARENGRKLDLWATAGELLGE